MEYITLEEAAEITGLKERTLKRKLQGKVPMIGIASYFRKPFFEFWMKHWEIAQSEECKIDKHYDEIFG